MINNKKIFICATEQSGDNIGYNIIKEIQKNNKYIIFEGVGGSKMLHLMSNQFFSIKEFNTLGIIEIINSIPKFFKILNELVSKVLRNNYDLIITIDSPDFNYPLVKKLRKKNIKTKVIHIVAPTVWAWREYRAKYYAKIFDELLVLFKFEIDYFKKHGLKTTFIGHPVYYIKSNKTKNIKKIIAFLPGSRKSEIESLAPYFNLAYNYLYKNSPDFIIFIPTLPHLTFYVNNLVSNWKIKVIVTSDINKIEEMYSLASKALVCSGTASLEIAKRQIPQLVIYKLNYFTELIVKLFIKVRFANIINIYENSLIIPELVNSNLTNKNFIKEFTNLIFNDSSNYNQIQNVKNSLKKIETIDPPYKIAVKSIINYLI